MPSNPNIRDLLQNSFLRYSKISDDPINIKREPEHESHEEEPLKKKKRVDPLDIENSLTETVLENGLVQRKKKKRLKKEKTKENNNIAYEDTNEYVLKENRVKKKKKKNLQVLENEWDVSSIPNVSDLNTIIANEEDGPKTSQIIEPREVKKKKKKNKERDTSPALKTIVAKEEDNSRTSQIVEPRKVKKKKKKNKERDTSPDLNTIVANEEDNSKTSQIIEPRKVKKKKKKNKERDTSPDLNTIVANEEDNPKTSQIIEPRKVKNKKKKNKERDISLDIEDGDFGVPKGGEKTAHFEIKTQNYSTGSQSSKKKTKRAEDFRSRFKSVEMILDSENEDEETSVKEKQNANMVEIKIEAEETKPDLNYTIQQYEEIRSRGVKIEKKRLVNRYYKPDYFNSDEDYTISMAFKKESIEELNDSTGQIKAAIKWILSQNIKVSPLNMTHKRNYYIFPKNYSDKIVEDTGTPLGFFTEVEDEEILQRIQFLEKNGVITSAKGLCNELKEDSKIHKHTKRIIGLYLCQNLTNRLAFYTTERMLKLMDKLTATPKKAKVVTDRIPWTIDDDKIIVKAVLFEIGSQR